MVVNPALTLGSFLVAIMVGLTGMGGGALLTPMLMIVFGVPPLAAVSSDLVASAVTKPVGAFVHLRRGSVHLRLAGWLSAGSVPAAFLGGLLGWWLGPEAQVQTVTERATGVVLVIAAVGVVAKNLLKPSASTVPADQAASRGTGARSVAGPSGGPARGAEGGVVQSGQSTFFVRKLPTLLIGIIVGLAVGITSTGSGTLVIAALAALYPALPAARLVGTDLAQAVPMVLAAAAAHLIAGDVHFSVTAPLLIGGVPGVIVGALLATRVPGGVLRPFLSVIILASGLSLLGLSPVTVGVTAGVAVAVLAGLNLATRRRSAAVSGSNAAATPDSPSHQDRSVRPATESR